MNDCVVRQGVLVKNVPYQQISNLSMDGFCTIEGLLNTDNGRLYGNFTKSGSTYTLNLYKDSAKADLVAHAVSTALGVASIVPDNQSGLSGTVNFAQYAQDDTYIDVICFLSRDRDLPMANLETVLDYDPVNGFAAFHGSAFAKIREYTITRYKSLIWNPSFIDTKNINGGVGGYDLARVNNFFAFKEASAHYALYQICDRQTVEEGSIFHTRAKQSRELYKAFLETQEVQFDLSGDRVEDKARSGAIWKFARA
jgi:hypothetical protein